MEGNVFITGETQGALDGQSFAGGDDIFVTKYDGAGMKLWTRQLGTAEGDQAGGVATDVEGNVFITGYTYGALDGQTNTGGSDIFVTKYDGAGMKLWTRQLGTATIDQALGVATDVEGKVFITGYTNGALDGQSNAGLLDIFVARVCPP